MANIIPLTAKLQAFKDTVSPSISSMENTKNEIANYLNEATTTYESAYNGITSAITDDQGKVASQSLALVKQAVEIMKNSITNDMGNILSECSKISDEIARIESEIERGNKLTPGWWESVWNDITGFFTSEWCDNDAGEIKRINEEVGQSMNALEAQLDAIASSSNSIRLGIIGNMVAGGTLGSYIDFASSYNFNLQQWKAENPIYRETLLGQVGGFVVGLVETPLKMVEGLVDTAALIVADVLAITGADTSGIVNWIATDHVGNFINNTLYNGTDAYIEARTLGKGVSDIFIRKLLSKIPIVRGVVAVSTAGRTAEYALANGANLLTATGGAVAGGVVDYIIMGRMNSNNSGANSGSNNVIQLGGGDNLLKLPAAGETVKKILKDGSILLSNGNIVDQFGKIIGSAL